MIHCLRMFKSVDMRQCEIIIDSNKHKSLELISNNALFSSFIYLLKKEKNLKKLILFGNISKCV